MSAKHRPQCPTGRMGGMSSDCICGHAAPDRDHLSAQLGRAMALLFMAEPDLGTDESKAWWREQRDNLRADAVALVLGDAALHRAGVQLYGWIPNHLPECAAVKTAFANCTCPAGKGF